MAVESIIFPWTMFTFSFSFILLMIAGLIVWIWAIVDCLRSDLPDGDKIVWILILILLHVLGAIVYLIVAKTDAVKDMRMTKPKKGKRLYRDTDHQVLTGVSSGIGEYFDIDPVIIRLIWVALGFISAGSALIAYIIAAIIIPAREDVVKQQKNKAAAKKTA
ncbi:MAG: PspC domain-containing protein, partial [Nanobdellota archaeon]